jgi:hypothetical protein
MLHTGAFMEAKVGGMAPVFLAGNYAWDVDEQADDHEGTTGEDAGFENGCTGVKVAVITLKGWMDIAAGEYVPVQAKTIITNLKLYLDEASTVNWTFPVAEVITSKQGGTVKGKVEWSATVRSRGSYTYADP